MRATGSADGRAERGIGWLRILVLATAAASTLQAAKNYDWWWQLASGRLMVAQGRLLDSDPFSFTRPGFPWLNHEWLFQLVGYLGFRVAGDWLPALMTLLLGVAAYCFLFACALRRSACVAGAGLLLALSLAGARFRFDPRPEMASTCFLAVLCFLLHSSATPGHGRRAWLLFPLFAVWCNVHPAVLLGVAVAVLWLIGETIERQLRHETAALDVSRITAILLSPVAILLNPGGWTLITVPFSLHRIVGSGHAPNMEWARPRFTDFQTFYLTAFAAALFLLARWLKDLPPVRRLQERGQSPAGQVSGSWSRGALNLDWPPMLAAALAGALAFQQLRNIGFFFLLLPLALARPLGAVLQGSRAPVAAMKVLCGSVLVLEMAVFLRGAPEWAGESYFRKISPSNAVSFLERNDIGRHLFNDVKFGGYLIWKRYPAHRVFIDGRNEVYDSLLAEVFGALGSWERWEALLDRYDIDAAMLRRGQLQAVQYPPQSPGEAPRRAMRAFSAAYFQSSLWALVYWDDDALVFVRRGDPRHAAVLQNEFRIVNPDDAAHLLLEIGRGRIEASAALAEVERKLREDPLCATAIRLRGELLGLVAAGKP
jgi:hypothetical protein